MARPLKVVHVGLGPIGQGIARLVAETDGLQIVGATDPFPDHSGKDLGALLGLPRRLRVKVEGNPERFFRRARADVAVLSTSSALKSVKTQVAALVQRGMNVVSTCEELAFPTPERAAIARATWRMETVSGPVKLRTAAGTAVSASALRITSLA